MSRLPRDIQPGDIIKERYRIIEPLGRGGYGQTYLAEDTDNNGHGKCVVKQLKPIRRNPEDLEDAKQRFAKEADVLAKLGHHPQIPKLLDQFQEQEEFYLVQEFIDGKTIAQEIQKGNLTQCEVISLLQDVLEVLVFVHKDKEGHKEGVIHRDINPSNLMRRKQDGKIVVIDFGAVKEIFDDSVNNQGQTDLTKVIGKPGYKAPEQEERRPTFRSDIYSLGITTIKTLTGISAQEMQNHSQTQRSWQDQAQTKASKKLIEILDKMVQPEETNRYQSATEVLEDLQPLVNIGKILDGRYTIIDYLGGGTFSNTYLAENQRSRLKPRYIIKQLKPKTNDLSIRQETERRFATEIKVLEKLGLHNQIPRLLDHFDHNEEFYLVQELIDGEVFCQEIAGGKRLKQEDVISLLKDVLEILDFIHKERIIHCDIKPSNLMRRRGDGKMVLIDFGAVKEIGTSSFKSEMPRMSSPSISTAGYAPPEQLAGRTTFSSDFYALGITAIQALTGKFPEELQAKADPNTGELLWQDGVQINSKLARILNKMVSYDLKNRYKCAIEILKELKKLPNSITSPSPNSPLTNSRVGEINNLKYLTSRAIFILISLISIIIIHRLYLLGITIVANNYYEDGLQEAEQGNYQKAIENYDAALKLQPKLYEALVSKSFALGKRTSPSPIMDRNSDRNYLCQRALDIEPKFTPALNCIGWLANESGVEKELRKAIMYFEKVIELEKLAGSKKTNELMFAYYNKGEAHEKLGEKDKACESFELALKESQEKLATNPKESVALTIKERSLRKRCVN